MIADDKHWEAPHVMLIDFGMAKSFNGTRAGGTPGYMPPEFWQYQLWTPKGDMFALAVTFWGIYNFRQGGPFQVQDCPPFPRIQQATINNPMDCSKFPPGLREVVQRMATKDFRKRPTAKEALADRYFATLSTHEESGPVDSGMLQNLIKAGSRTSAQNLIAMEIAESKNLGQMKTMNKLFRQLDTDDDGTVAKDEAAQILKQSGISAASCDKLLENLMGSDGKISYSEFMAKMISSQGTLSSETLSAAFTSIDKDHSGTLSRSEIQALLSEKHLGKIMEGQSADELIKEMDINGDGVITFAEFRTAMLGGNSHHANKGHGFAVGDKVEYYSASYGKWVPCEVTAVKRSGHVQISCKPGAWIAPQQQGQMLRKAGGGKGGYA